MRSSVAQLAGELADVIIATDLLAMSVGVDLEEAATRSSTRHLMR
jgi:hypothetical protein